MSEYPEMFQQKTVQAKKQYRCESCNETVAAGEKYRRSTGMWDGKFDTIRQHVHCADLMEFVLEDYDGYDPLCFQDVYDVARDMEILSRWYPGIKE